jgi:DNA repair photolyase
MRDIEVGFTITTFDEEVKRIFEPYSSSIKERFSALETLSKEGIRTWVFIRFPLFLYLFCGVTVQKITNYRGNRAKISRVLSQITKS